MSADPADVIGRLADGHSLRDILDSLRPPGVRRALKRSAAVRTFDRELYDAVLAVGGADFPAFDDFVRLPEVERVPRSLGLHRLSDTYRATYWNAWWDDEPGLTRALPDELEDLTRRLAAHYRDPDRPLELLTQLALIAPAEAEELFEREFREADEEFDLARCQDLLNALCDAHRTAVLDPALVELHDDRATYLRARGHSSSDFLWTGTFYETPGTIEAYRALFDNAEPRVLELHAPAGSGKTMELRWLLSRQLVPERSPLDRGRIPGAKSDFDFLDPVNVTRHPWLVLLDAAAQLNQQLPGSPFQEFLEAYGWAAPLLHREVTDPDRAAAASRRLRNQRARLARSVPNRFIATLNGVLGDRPVVLVFDTLEEVHLRPQGDLDELLALLRTLHDRCPGIRLVLSGRYPVSGGLGLPVATRTPGPFTAEDAAGYLGLRRVADARVRDAVITKAGGNPFKLSLLADLVQRQPSLTSEQIEQYDADLIYLVLRVVNRVDDPQVRWLLRYGVVPRTLTLDFVRTVMEPYLRRGMSGEPDLDDPDADPLPVELRRNGPTFPTDALAAPTGHPDVERAWQRLRAYAGTSSWVGSADRTPNALRFHPGVLGPMRAVVRRHPVHDQLQLAAATYFERLAADRGPHWIAHLCEAIYHRFRLAGQAATEYWRDVLDGIGLDQPEQRQALAAELLGPDYLDASGVPLPWRDGEPIVDEETAIEARFIRMSATAQIARLNQVPPDDQLWSRVERDLAEIGATHRRLGYEVVPWWRLAYVQAALRLKVGDPHEAERLLRAAAPHLLGPEEVRLHVLLGDVELALGRASAPDTYARARDAVRQHQPGSGRLATIVHARQVKAYHLLGRFDRAARVLDTALAVDGLDPDHGDELRLLAVENGLATGRLTWARTQVEALSDAPDEPGPLIAAARIGLAEHDPVSVRSAVGPTLPHLVTSARSGPPHAAEHELAGLAAGALARFDEALGAFESARALWHAEGDLEAVARCHTQSALLHLRDIGNLTLAEQHLAEASELHPPAPGPAWLTLTLARAELQARRGAPQEALDLVRQVVARLGDDGPASALVRAAVAGLAIGLPGHRDEFLRALGRNLRRITPASARVVALDDLHRVPDPDGDPESTGRFHRIRWMLRGHRRLLDPGDIALRELTIAEVHRLSGRREKARRTLMAAAEHSAASASPFFVRDWARALDRLGRPVPEDAAVVRRFLEAFREHDMLTGIFHVERAEAASQRQDGERAKRELRLARAAIDRAGGRETQWQARSYLVEGEIERLAHVRSVRESAARAHATFMLLGSGIEASPLSEHFTEYASPPDTSTEPLPWSTAGEQVDIAEWVSTIHDTAPPGALLGSLRRLLDGAPTGTAEDLSEDLATLLGDHWPEMANELTSLVASRPVGRPDPTALVLVVGDRRWNMMPWELAYHPGTADLPGPATGTGPLYRTTSTEAVLRDEVGFVQMALNRLTGTDLPVDGSFGDRTRAAVWEYQRRRGLDPDGVISEDLRGLLQQELVPATPLVVLVQQSPWQQLASHRGHASTGVDLQRLYRRHGFDVEVVENPTLDALTRRLRAIIDGGRVPAVLHFSGGLREFSGGVAFSFVTGPWEDEPYAGSRPAEEIPVSSMHRLLATFPRDGVRPVVVLDVDRPRGVTDMALHLLQRNAFAGELFSLGRCAAVLGTGLAGREGSRLYEELVGSMASGRSLGEVIGTLRGLAPGEMRLDRVLPFLGAALFTHMPWLRLTPERQWRR